MASTKTYGGMSADARRERRREQLLDAGLELLGTRGWTELSVRAVCREAQLSSRFFYESFENLDALAVAVVDRVAATATGAILRAVAEAPPEPAAQAHAAIAAFVAAVTDDPRNAQIAFKESLAHPPLLERRRTALREGIAITAAHGRATYNTSAGDKLVDIAATLLAGGIAELLLAWVDGELDVGRDELVDTCAALFMATVEGAVRFGAERRVS